MSNECTKIFVPDGNNDALTTAALMNGGMGGNGMWNNPIWAIVFLAALRNGGIFGDNNGNGGRCQMSQIQEQLQTIQGNNSLMSAIQGGTNEVRSLANTLNCDYNAVQGAINGVQSAICNVGNQLGMGTAQVINAINSGDTSIITAVKDCCCQTQQSILKMGYEGQINNLQQSQLIQNGFCQIGYEAAQNANGIKQAISDQTLSVIAKIDAQESARKDREINALTAQLATVNARAERQAELAPIYKALSDIQAKQPSTVSVPYPQLTAIPNYMLYGGAIAAGAAAGVFGVNGAGVLG